MSSIVDARPEIASYLEAVRDALDDLPAAERDDLLAEVESSLIETAGETGTIAARLGPPDEFAAELRAAAGLAAPAPTRRRARAPRELAGEALRAVRTLAASRGVTELAPIWWAARGYVVVAFVAAAWAGWSPTHPAVPSIGNGRVGLLAVLAVATVSVWLGRRARRSSSRVRLAGIAVNVLLVLAALPVLHHLAQNVPAPQTIVQLVPAGPQAGLVENGVAVENIYPYSRDGRLLHDVLLYDGAGNPLEIGANGNDPNRRLVRTADRYTPLYNAFPIRYYEPGTTRVANPDAGPQVQVPSLVPGP
jgi:hypothetical protein